jgi:cytochrome c
VFLLIQLVSVAIFDTHAEEVAYIIETPDDEGGGQGAEEEAVDVDALVAAADPAAGESQFRKCAACHKVDGSNGVGPHLDGVVGRDIGAVEGFGYSDALTSIDGAWTPENIFHFIENPKGFAPGTAMAFAGLKPEDDRADLIAYLESVSN